MNFVELEDACEFLDSKRKPIKESERRPGPFPYYGANGQQGWINGYIFDEPLVLLAEDGGHFGSKINPIAYKIEGKTWVNNHAHVLRPLRDCNIDYLKHVLSYYDVTKLITGTTRPKLTKGDAEQIRIPFPELNEQKRIASQLEHADRLRRLRRYVLEMSESFLPAMFIEMFGDPHKNPKGWDVEFIESLSEKIDYGVTASAINESVGPKFLRITDIQNGSVNWQTVPYCRMPQDEITESRLQNGDIVFARTGATTGKSFLIRSCPEASVFASYLIRIRPNKKVNSAFLYNYFQSEAYWAQINTSAVGSTQPGVNATKLSEIKVYLPPIDLQSRFAKEYDRFEKLRSMQKEALRQSEYLFQSLLHQTFGKN